MERNMTVKDAVDKLKKFKVEYDNAKANGESLVTVYNKMAMLVQAVSNFTPDEHKEFQRLVDKLGWEM